MSETRTDPPNPSGPAGPTGPHDPLDAQETQGPRVTRDQATDLGRVVRTTSTSPQNRYLAGVAGGIARHLDIDPLIVRIALVIAVFFGGSGLVLYGAGWLFMPDERDGKAMVTLDTRSRNVVLWLGVAVAGLAAIGDVAGGMDVPWWIIPAIIVILILNRVTDRRGRSGSRGSESIDLETKEILAQTKAATQAALEHAQASTERALTRARARAASKRGPILFWFTMALVILAEIALAVIDGAGADITEPAYPALALGLIGLMLLLGAFWGRAGGLILAGLVAAAGLGATTAHDRWGDDHQINETPLSASAVLDSYSFGVGEMVLDLRGVTDLAGLDGRTIDVRGTLGEIKVLLPPGIGVRAWAKVSGFGEISLLGHEQDGISIDASAGASPTPGGPTITVDAQMKVGEITISNDESEALDD